MRFLASTFVIVVITAVPQNVLAGQWQTNAPAIFKASEGSPISHRTNPTGEAPRFDHFIPGSLAEAVWTNFTAHTNNRTTQVWSKREHPSGWPGHSPLVAWNTNCLLWGFQGMTALSPCWQDEGGLGQVPVTALTRRHGFTRGHDMGADGFAIRRKGKKVWFLTADDKIVEVRVKREVVRIRTGPTKEDYTILFFDRDLPASIKPIRVTSYTNIVAKYPSVTGAPWLIYKTEQSGNISANFPGFTLNTWKGGDSGSPDMLPMPGELIFFQGRSTSGPSAQMQSDMDGLCRLEHLDPKNYQLNWLDISTYPAFVH